jgi:hypothetical protein
MALTERVSSLMADPIAMELGGRVVGISRLQIALWRWVFGR